VKYPRRLPPRLRRALLIVLLGSATVTLLWRWGPSLLARYAFSPAVTARDLAFPTGGGVRLQTGRLALGAWSIGFDALTIRGFRILDLLPGRTRNLETVEIDLGPGSRLNRIPASGKTGYAGPWAIRRLVIHAPHGALYSNGDASLFFRGEIQIQNPGLAHIGVPLPAQSSARIHEAILRLRVPPITVSTTDFLWDGGPSTSVDWQRLGLEASGLSIVSGPTRARGLCERARGLYVDSLDLSWVQLSFSESDQRLASFLAGGWPRLPIYISQLACPKASLVWVEKERNKATVVLQSDDATLFAKGLETRGSMEKTSLQRLDFSGLINHRARVDLHWERTGQGEGGRLSARTGPFPLSAFAEILSNKAHWRVASGEILGLRLSAALAQRSIAGDFDLFWRDLALAPTSGPPFDFIRRHNLPGQGALPGIIDATNTGGALPAPFALEALGREILRVLRRY